MPRPEMPGGLYVSVGQTEPWISCTRNTAHSPASKRRPGKTLRRPDGGCDRGEFGAISTGPHHLDAPASVLEAGDHVDVQVVDVLARWTAVIPAHVHPHRVERALDLRLNGLDGEEELTDGRSVEVRERGSVSAGHDEDVPTGRREDIQEGDGPWTFVNHLGRDAAGYDFAKDAIGHVGSVAQDRRV